VSLTINCFRDDPGDCSSFVREIIVVTLATKRSFPTKVGTVYHLSQYTSDCLDCQGVTQKTIKELLSNLKSQARKKRSKN
ncbi:MAG: hypothetical protein ACKPIC_16235, partial [Microcystis panniformis]